VTSSLVTRDKRIQPSELAMHETARPSIRDVAIEARRSFASGDHRRGRVLARHVARTLAVAQSRMGLRP
jgi:hypothetical protein